MNIHSEFYAPPQYIPSVSAGFDAADGDELGECCVTPAGFAHMTHMLSTLAGGRLVVALEVGSCSRMHTENDRLLWIHISYRTKSMVLIFYFSNFCREAIMLSRYRIRLLQ